MMPHPTDALVRDHLNGALADRYLIERELGRGGMASVWLARDLRHDRIVALKVLAPELASAVGVERFLREIRLTARIQHPNIVPVLDSGSFLGPEGTSLPWFTMTYVAGESLRQRIDRERQIAVDEAVRIAESVSSALQMAHDKGVVHRDIKPENLLLAGNHAYVADFGIARAIADIGTDRLTGSGLVVGTPAYMSPEQATNDTIDERSDQYALATVLYEMLAGEPPFTGPSAQAVIARRLSESARPIRPVRSTVPEALEAAMLRALERVPADRFGSMSDFASALRLPTTDGSKPWRRPKFRRWFLAGAILVAAAATSPFVLERLGAARRMPNAEAQARYRRGVSSYVKRTPEGAADALAAFNAAIALDSGYSEAWAGLAKTYIRIYGRGFALGAARDSALRSALKAADRAVAADSSNADAWLTKGMVDEQVDPTDVAPALRAFSQAVVMDSTLGQAWQQLGNAQFEMGQSDAAVRSWHKAVAVEPKYTEGVSFVALGFYWRRQYDSASAWADSAIAIDPAFLLARQAQGFIAVEQGNFARGEAAAVAAERITTDAEFVNALAEHALVAARAGHRDESRRLLARAESLGTRLSPIAGHTAIYMAQPYAALNDPDHAIAWLRRFTATGDAHFQVHMRCDPPFDPLANDARFRSLLTMPKPPPPQGC